MFTDEFDHPWLNKKEHVNQPEDNDGVKTTKLNRPSFLYLVEGEKGHCRHGDEAREGDVVRPAVLSLTKQDADESPCYGDEDWYCHQSDKGHDFERGKIKCHFFFLR